MTKQQKIKEIENEKEVPKQSRVTRDILFLAFALFIIFILLFWVFNTSKPVDVVPTKDTISIKYTGNMEQFSESLLNSESMSLVANVTDLVEGDSRYVYSCLAGLAGSWGKLGKNISKLSIYVIDGNECTFSTPGISETQISNQSSVMTTQECIEKLNIEDSDPTHVKFNIQFGSAYTVFTTNVAYIFVDANFTEECSFRIPTFEDVGTIGVVN